jgi:hypothetical protein
MNALRIVLRDDALVVRLAAGAPSVFDVENSSVAVEVALAAPERVAAIYYQIDRTQPAGAIDACESGMREIALGSDAMVEEWSLGTPEVEARRTSDLDRLERLFSIARGCPNVDTLTTFRTAVVCDTWRVPNASSELSAYHWSLATPVEAYKPTPQNLATLIQALEDDGRDPDPFIVRPTPPAAGGAASGGAGGNGGDGG